MCGVSAIVHLDKNSVSVAHLRAMNAVVKHRGPDGVGEFSDGSVGLSHTRLSILDVQTRASQPMARRGHLLSYNGEIYNYLELRTLLAAKGYKFETTSDTEVLLVALIEWGKQALDRLCGMFSFVYYNATHKLVWAVRDRFGIKPLVWARVGQTVLFASEPKQILASGFVKPLLNAQTARAFLAQGSLNCGASTFFQGIEEIRGGEIVDISLERATVTVSKWYQLAERIVPHRLTYPSAIAALRERLTDSIVRHHRSDVPVGACLSGGIDSSCLVMLSRTLFPEKALSTISTFSRYQGYNETHFSKTAAEAAHSRAIQIEVDLERIWDPDFHVELGYYQDQPVPDGSHYNEYMVYKTAHENGLRVMLSGQGADEYFGGYGSFWFAAQYELLRSGRLIAFLDGLRANAETMKRSTKAEILNFFIGLRRFRKSDQQMIGPIRANWLRAPFSQTTRHLPGFRELSLLQLERTSVPYQLHSEDRNAMRWSVESRLPFLDHELVEFVAGLPTDFKVGGGYRKRILRDAVQELPASIAARRDKVGFASPDYVGLHKRAAELREVVRVSSRTFDDLIDSEVLLGAYDRMVADKSWYSPAFLRVIALDGWRRAHHVTT